MKVPSTQGLGLSRRDILRAAVVGEDLPEAPVAWLILAGDGTEMLGRLTHPPGFKPFAMGDGWMLGASRDALDVEHLELYRFAPSDTF